jgi:protein gp37
MARFSDPGQPFHGFANQTRHAPRWTGNVELIEGRLRLPLRWREPVIIFVNSASDLFHEAIPFEQIDRVFAIMADCSQHVFQVADQAPCAHASLQRDMRDP